MRFRYSASLSNNEARIVICVKTNKLDLLRDRDDYIVAEADRFYLASANSTHLISSF
jgi:hypothetical protein